jgi:hypothetical protein
MELDINILSLSSIEDGIKKLTAYKESLPEKMQRLCDKLAEIGAKEARLMLGKAQGMVRIEVSSLPEGIGSMVVMLGEPITTTYLSQGQEVTVTISSVMLTEFGAGVSHMNTSYTIMGDPLPSDLQALNTPGSFGKHQGSKSIWSWRDTNGEIHYSTGTNPESPMYFAGNAILESVEEAAREVFR